jgi:uncharacterized protein YjbI with pentapeptide repeats
MTSKTLLNHFGNKDCFIGNKKHREKFMLSFYAHKGANGLIEWNKWRADEAILDLRGIPLVGLKLQNANLTNINFSGAFISSCVLHRGPDVRRFDFHIRQ